MMGARNLRHLCQLAGLGAAAVLFGTLAVSAQTLLGTEFTYQGQLKQGGLAANGLFDFEFRLFDDETLGRQVGITRIQDDLVVSDGLFTTELDFGAGLFTGLALWLEISVRPGAESGGYSVLAPRQPLSATPYAQFSPLAGLAVTAGDADRLDGLDASAFLPTTGGTITGSVDASGTLSATAFELNGQTITSWPSGGGSGGQWSDVSGGIAFTSGSVGIGTSAPACPLHVTGAVSAADGSVVSVDFSNAADSILAVGIDVEGSTLTGKGNQIGVRAQTSIDAGNHPQRGRTRARIARSAGFDFNGVITGVEGLAFLQELDNFNNDSVSVGTGGYLLGGTANGETLSLDSTGTYWVGGVFGRLLGTVDNTPAGGAVAAVMGLDENEGTAQSWAGFFEGRGYFSGEVGLGTRNPTNILTVVQSSATDPIADAWTIYSSRRWKSGVATLEDALGKVEQLRGVSYRWNADGKPDIGLIAEEVGEVVPEVVVYEDNGTDARGVDYSRLVALLIEATKEQQRQIRRLEQALCTSDPSSELCR